MRSSKPSTTLLSHRGVTIAILSSPAAGFTLLDYSAPAGFAGVQPHRHDETTEWFYVVSGTMAWTIGGCNGEAADGGYIEVPPGAVHVWRNASVEQPLRMLVGFDRRGFDQYFRELIDMAAAAPEWPPSDPTPWKELGKRFDTYS